jgi:SHS2 domain-containing protein
MINDDARALEGIEIIDHTADWAIRVTAADLQALFRLAAEGMALLMVGPGGSPGAAEVRLVALEAYDVESLLVAWLGELAYFAERDQFVGREFEVWAVSPTALEASVRGGRSNEIQKHIKAVTYHGLEVRQTAGGVEATFVFDV